MRQQLLNDFLPDDACPLGTQLCMETPIQIYQFGIEDKGTRDMVSYLNNHPFLFLYNVQAIECTQWFYCAG